jgi:hypothetical protein
MDQSAGQTSHETMSYTVIEVDIEGGASLTNEGKEGAVSVVILDEENIPCSVEEIVTEGGRTEARNVKFLSYLLRLILCVIVGTIYPGP